MYVGLKVTLRSMYGAEEGNGGGKVWQRTSGAGSDLKVRVRTGTLRSPQGPGTYLDLKLTLRSPGGQPGSTLKGRVRTGPYCKVT